MVLDGEPFRPPLTCRRIDSIEGGVEPCPSAKTRSVSSGSPTLGSVPGDGEAGERGRSGVAESLPSRSDAVIGAWEFLPLAARAAARMSAVVGRRTIAAREAKEFENRVSARGPGGGSERIFAPNRRSDNRPTVGLMTCDAAVRYRRRL